MITAWPKGEEGVIERVSQPLDRPVEIGSRRVNKQKMLKAFGNEPPAPDERVAEDQGGIVPDKTVSQRRCVDREDERSQNKGSKNFFHQADCVGQNQ